MSSRELSKAKQVIGGIEQEELKRACGILETSKPPVAVATGAGAVSVEC